MNLSLAFQTFLSYLSLEREEIADRKIEQIAICENLDDFLAVENSESGIVEYSTTYGFRILYQDRPEHNQFIIAKKGNGFSKARNLPYIYLQTKYEPPQLIVECPCVEAINYGYATAVELPYMIAPFGDEYPQGALVVCITEDNKESADFGYANAVLLPYSQDSVCIQKIDMLDTDYAAMFVDEPRF